MFPFFVSFSFFLHFSTFQSNQVEHSLVFLFTSIYAENITIQILKAVLCLCQRIGFFKDKTAQLPGKERRD